MPESDRPYQPHRLALAAFGRALATVAKAQPAVPRRYRCHRLPEPEPGRAAVLAQGRAAVAGPAVAAAQAGARVRAQVLPEEA